METLVLVTRDITPFNLLLPVAKLWGKEHVGILSEGASMSKWEAAGFGPNGRMEMLESANFVLAGASSPPKVEQDVLWRARTSGIFTSLMVDIPGAHRRGKFPICDIYFTADKACAEEIHKDVPIANVVIVGTTNAFEVTPPKATVDAVNKLRQKHTEIVVFAGGMTTEDLAVVARSLEEFMPNAALVLGFHPDPAKQPDQEKFHEAVAILKEQGRVYFPGDIPGNTHEIASLSNFVVGGYSGVLTTAARNGVPTICVCVHEVLKHLAIDCPGVQSIPMVTAGIAVEIAEPCDFSILNFPKVEDVRKHIHPYQPKLVVKKIKEFLQILAV